MIPANSIMEIPLPMPFSLMRSPSQMIIEAPATKQEMTEEEKALFDATEDYVKKFEAAMDDDANTADAVSAVFELVKYINTNAFYFIT